MKNLLKPLIIAFSLSFFFIMSCDKDNPTQTTEITPQKKTSLTIKETKKVNLNDFFKNEESLEKINKQFGNLKLLESELFTVNENNDVEYLLVPFISENKYLYIYHSKTNNDYLPLIFENDMVESTDNKYSGYSYVKTIENELLSKEEYIKGKRVSFESYSPNAQNSQKGRVNNACYDCINSNYNIEKAGCESDFLCDIACSFSVTCKAVFATAAIASCTSGSSHVCNPFY